MVDHSPFDNQCSDHKAIDRSRHFAHVVALSFHNYDTSLVIDLMPSGYSLMALGRMEMSQTMGERKQEWLDRVLSLLQVMGRGHQSQLVRVHHVAGRGDLEITSISDFQPMLRRVLSGAL
jgi:hypothetical protein